MKKLLILCFVICSVAFGHVRAARPHRSYGLPASGLASCPQRPGDSHPASNTRAVGTPDFAPNASAARTSGLIQWVQKARRYNNEYTREKVYLHLDNNAYFEDETIWFKAYVVRASTLCPDTALSHVLYVDLLDSRGEIVEQKLVHLNEEGQGEGELELKSPMRSGYYEVRAYTRSMTNWGSEACFSRVVPVFRAKDKEKGADASQLDISVETEQQLRSFARQRPMGNTGAQTVLLGERTPEVISVDFFPEGGNRVGGVEQRVAYKVTSNQGSMVTGVFCVCRADGTVIAESVPNSEGMGIFTLPSSLPADEPLFLEREGKRYDLPAVEPQAHYTLSAEKHDESVDIFVHANADRERLLGLLVSCRAAPVYFDTLHVYAKDDIVMTISEEVLRDGVNTIDLFDETGHSLCRRLMWKQPADARRLQLEVRQNEPKYAAFKPIALDMVLTDDEGYAVPDATFSVSVRDADADLVASPMVDLTTELLLSSEVKGYIHRPEQYDDTPQGQKALDLLLMVQGWTADDFETMAGVREFALQQPLEDHLLLRGTVYKDNDKLQPYPNLDLHLQMYTLQGASLDTRLTTDDKGEFAYSSDVDYCGEWIAQITTDETVTSRRGVDTTKKRWSRVAFDRWFAPPLRPFDPGELKLQAPRVVEAKAASLDDDFLFEWEDTIPRVLKSYDLDEATVVHHNRYGGFIGNRYTYNGGEKAGLRHSSLYINVAREVERRKDAGLGEATIFEIIQQAVDRPLVFTQPVSAPSDPMAGRGRRQNSTEAEVVESLADLETAAPSSSRLKSSSRKSAAVSDGKSTWYQYVDYAGVTYMTDMHSVAFLHNVPMIEINNHPCIFFLNNELVGYGYGGSLGVSESDNANEFQSVVIMTEREDWMRFWPVGEGTDCPASLNPYKDGKPYYAIFLYNRPDAYRFYTKKGVDKRLIQGFSVPKKFYAPLYNGINLPDARDQRRTLYWSPNVTTDSEGHASVVFFNSAVDGQRIAISARGITSDGSVISYDR